MIVNCELLKAPVTALGYAGDYLLAGSGPFVRIYSVNTDNEVFSMKALSHQNIHGILTCSSDPSKVCIYGEKSAKTFTMEGHTLLECSNREFTDWIWSAQFLAPDSTIALALGHNSIVHWNWMSDIVLNSVECEVQCILYSAHFIGQTWSTLVLAAGTVFSQVVFWSPSVESMQDGRQKSFNRLRGHKGVIFDMDFRADICKFASVSDDRSVRVYSVHFPGSYDGHMIPVSHWEKAEFVLEHELYGHLSRVWRVCLLQRYLVTVGEDVTCCVWAYDGVVKAKFKGHKGKSIWSVAVHPDEQLVTTGGGDCSIRSWKLDGLDLLNGSGNSLLCLPSELVGEGNFAKVVKVRDTEHILVSTSHGSLLEYNCISNRWRHIFSHPSFQSYSVIGTWDDGQVIVYGNIEGRLVLLDCCHYRVIVDASVCCGKVYSVVCFMRDNNRQLLVTGPDGWMGIFCLTTDGTTHVLDLCQTFTLPVCKQRWVSSAVCITDSDMVYMVCGDRGGTVHLYTWMKHDHNTGNLQALNPVQSFPKIHGKAGVTCVCCHGDTIYTAGRDGHYREYILADGQLELKTASKVFKGFNWIERLQFTENDMLVLGYHTSFFVVWSVGLNQSLFKVECGGGHRSWGFCTGDAGSTYACVKVGDVQVCTISNTRQQKVICPALHGRELTCVRFIHQFGNTSVCVTASEDTDVKIVKLNSSGHLATIKSLSSHISSVRALAVCKKPSVTDDSVNVLLFSAGGRAQLKCWHVTLDTEDSWWKSQDNTNSQRYVSPLPLNCKCELLKTLCLSDGRSKSWKVSYANTTPETRFMSITAFYASKVCEGGCQSSGDEQVCLIGAACSDGLVRLFSFHESSKTLTLTAWSNFHNHCVLCVGHVTLADDTLLLYSAATDGHIAFWDVCSPLSQDGDARSQWTPLYTLKAHQSGVNCVAVNKLHNGDLLVVSGGDDNALHVSQLVLTDGRWSLSAQSAVASAHATQITGVSFLNAHTVVSTSIDQRVNIWTVHLEKRPTLQLVNSVFINIADVSYLETWLQKGTEGIHQVAVTGVGLQCLTLQESGD